MGRLYIKRIVAKWCLSGDSTVKKATYDFHLLAFVIQIIRESEVDRKTAFQIYLFLTPQCQYEETALGDILINNSTAIAIMHVAAGQFVFLHSSRTKYKAQTLKVQ